MKTSSSLYSEASGPIGSVEFSRTAAGVTLRNKPVYKAPQTNRQGQNRSAVAAASVAWTGMTPLARESYRLATLRVPQVDKFGRVFYLSGWNFFCRRWFSFFHFGSFFLDRFIDPINLNLPYVPGRFPIEYTSADSNNRILFTNLNVDSAWVLFYNSDRYSAFRTETPIYNYESGAIVSAGSTWSFDINFLSPGRYYFKISVLSSRYTWSTTLFRTFDII